MEEAFLELRNEAPTKELRTCIETLIKIFRNVVLYPEEQKYRWNELLLNLYGLYYSYYVIILLFLYVFNIAYPS